MKFKLLRAYEQYREQLAFVVYLALVLALAPQVAQLIGSAWEVSQVIKPLASLTMLVGLSSDVVVLGFVGLFVGLLGLMTVDRKKRWSALLLWIGFGIIVYLLMSSGQLIPEIEGANDLAWIAPGALFGLIVGGGLGAVRLRSIGPTEFRRGTWAVYMLITLVVLVSLLELHIDYPEFLSVSAEGLSIQLLQNPSIGLNSENLALNSVVGLASIVTVRRFVRYDAGEDFFILGPPSSGKSLLLIAAYLQALKRGENKNVRNREALDPSQDLMELVENLDRDTSKWIVEATGRSELRDLRFKYIRGSLFPKNVTISSIDYAGEHLRRIPASLAGEIDDPDKELELITDGIEDSDTIILLVDVERHVNNEGLGLAEYFRILEEAGDKGVVIVATKCDILADAFWEDREVSPEQAFGEFRQYVEDELCRSEQFNALLRQTPDSEVHPVYYETEFNEEGERVPVRDESGSVVTIGFDRLLNRLGR
jgi:GTPase SAR1 family protein